MTVASALAELERSPALHDHIFHLQRVIDDEDRRRECFYNDLDEDTRAEFINGQIVVHSPSRRDHLRVIFYVSNLVGNFALDHDLGEVFTESCLVRCRRNDYAPDICFFKSKKAEGFSGKQSIFSLPDLIVEVLSPTTEKNDRTLKLRDYARHGVGEYWIVDADERVVEQYILPAGEGEYELKARLTKASRLTSVVLTGFVAPVAAFFDAGKYQRAKRELSKPVE